MTQLIDFLATTYNRDGTDCRLRDHSLNRFYYKEELDTKLRRYENFLEGGVRLQLESGRSPTMAETIVYCCLNKKEDDMRQFFFNADITVKEAKA